MNDNLIKNASDEAKSHAFLVGAVISRFSIEERFRLEEKLVQMIIDKRPYYKTVKKREVVMDTVSDLLDAIIQNGL
jgi:regulator of sigma D